MNKNHKKPTLSEQAYEYIKNEIVAGNLRGDEIITENSIAKLLNMSRTPVKKALTQLEMENYVKCIDGVGTIVLGLSILDLADIYEVRTSIETLALRTAITRIPQREINRVREILLQVLKGYEQKQKFSSEYISQVDAQVHNLLIENTLNNYVKTLMQSIESRIERYRYEAYNITDTGRESTLQHLKILECIELRDYEKAKEALQKHIQWSFETLSSAFSTLYIA